MEKSDLKSFYKWYFEDSFKISSPSLYRGSKRLGKSIALVLSFVLIFIGFAIIIDFVYNDYYIESLFLFSFSSFLGAIILPWFIYRFIRGFFWIVDGFLKPKE